MAGLSFCAIDFETANAFRGSPCAVGLVRVRDGVAEARATFLMRPPSGYDDFDPFNVELHGITATMVRGEPRFAARLPEILAFAQGLPLVAHNAAFDLGVIRDACEASGLAWPHATYVCTLVLARRTWDLLSYSLPWVADAAGLALNHHHDPAEDAWAAAWILEAAARLKAASSIEALLAATHCVLGSLTANGWHGCTHTLEGMHPPSANPDADPAHPFYGRQMVFTGARSSMVRARAWELVAEKGGQAAEGVTRHTNILVVGYQDARTLRPGESLSAKARKAADLRAAGQPIELMPEVDFLQLLEL